MICLDVSFSSPTVIRTTFNFISSHSILSFNVIVENIERTLYFYRLEQEDASLPPKQKNINILFIITLARNCIQTNFSIYFFKKIFRTIFCISNQTSLIFYKFYYKLDLGTNKGEAFHCSKQSTSFNFFGDVSWHSVLFLLDFIVCIAKSFLPSDARTIFE